MNTLSSFRSQLTCHQDPLKFMRKFNRKIHQAFSHLDLLTRLYNKPDLASVSQIPQSSKLTTGASASARVGLPRQVIEHLHKSAVSGIL
jgi:hypothetical protein